MRSVLVIGDDEQVVTAVRDHLARDGVDCRVEPTAAAGLAAHRHEGAELILLLLPLADQAGTGVMRQLLGQDPRAFVVVAGRDAMVPGAPEALDAGALEYVSNPRAELQGLLSVLNVSLGTRQADAQLRYLRRKDAARTDWHAIVGHCPAMRRVFATIRQVCQRTTSYGAPTILITGETGTGKGLIAKTIHYNSARRSRSFVDLNCTALPATMIEAELFGHVRGAFTDARASRAGLLETANGGTLFLDEIGALQPDLQAKLLTVIEEKTVRRLGASDASHVDVQVIAATHRDLGAMVTRGEFREDLFHRLNVIHIELPPLRARAEDRVLLAESHIDEMCREYGVPRRHLSDDARAAIEAYYWPGNVRELRNQIERIILLEDAELITAAHLRLPHRGRSAATVNAAGAVSVDLPPGGCDLEALAGALEREVISAALARHQGNVSRTARYLGVTRQSLIYRMRKHDLQRPTA